MVGGAANGSRPAARNSSGEKCGPLRDVTTSRTWPSLNTAERPAPADSLRPTSGLRNGLHRGRRPLAPALGVSRRVYRTCSVSPFLLFRYFAVYFAVRRSLASPQDIEHYHEDRDCPRQLNPQIAAFAQEEQANRRHRSGGAQEVPVQLLGLFAFAKRGRHSLAGIDDRVGDVAIAVAIQLEVLSVARQREALQSLTIEVRRGRDLGIMDDLAVVSANDL